MSTLASFILPMSFAEIAGARALFQETDLINLCKDSNNLHFKLISGRDFKNHCCR